MDLTLNNAVMGVELSGIRQFTYLVRDTPGACALTIGEPDLNTPDVILSGIRQFTYLVRDTPGACALTIGEPDLNTPDVIKEAAKAALDANDTHYPPGNGYPYALEAISKFEAEAHGLHYAPSEIILTVGATEALFASFSTILNPGDEVIIPTPAFGLYEALVQLQGGVPVSLPTEHNHFQIVPEELKAAITDRTKAIILTSPNNPTGCVYTKETLDAVHAILRDKPIFVLCDDVYRTLTYCEDYHSFAEYQDMRDRIIVVQSFSKPYAMTGWRLGYCMADAKLMDRIQVFHQYCVTSVPSFVQRACVTALETDGHQRCGGDLPQAPGLRLPAPGGHGPGRGEAGGRLLHVCGHPEVRHGLQHLLHPDAEGGPGGRHPRHPLRHRGVHAPELLLLRRGPERGIGPDREVHQEPVNAQEEPRDQTPAALLIGQSIQASQPD